MKYGNNELRERWKAIKRQAWNDDEFNEQVEKFEKYAVEEFQRVQKNANIKLRILEEKYKQDREEIMKGLYADEIEINDSCIEIIDEIYNEIPKESRVKNTTSMRQQKAFFRHALAFETDLYIASIFSNNSLESCECCCS